MLDNKNINYVESSEFVVEQRKRTSQIEVKRSLSIPIFFFRKNGRVTHFVFQHQNTSVRIFYCCLHFFALCYYYFVQKYLVKIGKHSKLKCGKERNRGEMKILHGIVKCWVSQLIEIETNVELINFIMLFSFVFL